jgi:hypothetical protein
MKTLIVSFVSLLLGLAAGWYFEHRQAEHEMTDAVKHIQIHNRQEAAIDLRAIELIQSGDTHRVVQLLSIPIASFYAWNMNLIHNDKVAVPWNNEVTKSLLTQIEQFARTNQVVAAQIQTNIHYGLTNRQVR